MKTISCKALVMPNGHLILPPGVVKRLHVKRKTSRRVIIFNDNIPKKSLSQFCGKWKDERDADEIIREIYADREKNNRADTINL